MYIISKSYWKSEDATANAQTYIDAWRRMGALVVALHKRRQAGAKRQKRHNILYFLSKSYWFSEVALEVFEFHPAGTMPTTGPPTVP